MKIYFKNTAFVFANSKKTYTSKPTAEITINSGFYKIVDEMPVFNGASTAWGYSDFIDIDRLKDISVWCTSSSGISGLKIQGIMYFSNTDFNSYVGGEYASISGGNAPSNLALDTFTIPSGAKYAIIQTSITKLVSTDMVTLYDED